MQTAVEWFIENINKNIPPLFFPKEIAEQANKMFEQQIIDAYQAGDGDAYNLKETEVWAEQYYNETYGSNGSDELGQSLEWNREVTNGNNVEKVPNVTSSQTEISDEEIKKAAHEHGYEHHSFFTAATSNQKKLSWIAACKWYREQLKKKQ